MSIWIPGELTSWSVCANKILTSFYERELHSAALARQGLLSQARLVPEQAALIWRQYDDESWQECQNCVDSMMKSHLHSFSRQVHVLRASIASAEGTTRTTHAITPVMATNCNLLHFLMLLKISDACSTAIICRRRENPAVLSCITRGESSW
jgi:hypothetical protein